MVDDAEVKSVARDAEARLLPAAMDSGSAVLINSPFGRNSMFAKVAGKPLPDFAKEFDATTWAQFFLKFTLTHPAITAVTPATPAGAGSFAGRAW